MDNNIAPRLHRMQRNYEANRNISQNMVFPCFVSCHYVSHYLKGSLNEAPFPSAIANSSHNILIEDKLIPVRTRISNEIITDHINKCKQ